MDLVNQCLSPLCSCMQIFVTRQDISYVFRTKEKIDELKNAMKHLVATKEDVQRKLDDPQHNGKLLDNQHQVKDWLGDVGEKKDKVERLLDEYGKGNCVPACSCSLNCYSRYKIGRNAFKLKDEITQLTTKQPEIKFIDIPLPKPVPESSKIMGKKIVSNLDLACSYLADETNDIIGIWGMGGVGKTTLLKKINQRLLDNANMGFDHVLFIEASQNTQSEELRKEIAEKLHLAPNAGQQDIFHALKTKNIVLLLDNIWKPVGLVGLGIINPYRDDDDSTNQYKHKVIFTTRSEDVCAQMRASKIIKVECLEPDEAWALFKHNVNQAVIESDEQFKKIAWQVMNKCGGLPLALQVIGKAMSNKKIVQDWEFILTSLEKSDTQVVQGVQESLLPILKFSYDNLSENIQQCFLYASALRGSSKDDLLEFWIGLALIGDFDNLQHAYGKAELIFNNLKESCLLNSSDDDHVDLHDVIYEMAVWIASDCGRNRKKWIVKEHFWATPSFSINAENMRSANRLIITFNSCTDNILEEFVQVLSQCSDLLCLVIHGCPLKNIPERLIIQMPNLTYLDLSRNSIKELPEVIKCLVNLQYLNISNTQISSLPKELVYLKKLQYLICRYTWNLGKLEDGLMSTLLKLKVIDVYPAGWVEPEELKKLKKHIKAIGMRVVSQEVCEQLSCLPTTRLCLYDLDIDSLSFDNLSCKNHGLLQELEIRVCQKLKELVMNGSRSHLNELRIIYVRKLQNIIWKDLSPPEFFIVLRRVIIIACNLDNLAWVLHLPCLSYLSINDCEEIKTLFYIEEREIQQEEVSKHPTFPALKSLHLENLPKLVSISNFALDFPQLSLKVDRCPNLKKLPFKSGINNNQRIIFIDCEREWWESLEWDDATIPSHLRPDFFPGRNP